MSFTLIGPKTIFDNHFTYGEFFGMPEKFGLPCPVIERLRQAHNRLHDVVFRWDSEELPLLRQELLALKASYDADASDERRGEEIYQILLIGE